MAVDAILAERTFAQGRNRWRVDSQGRWSVYMWGWWPTGANPRGQFVPISADKVPHAIQQSAARNS